MRGADSRSVSTSLPYVLLLNGYLRRLTLSRPKPKPLPGPRPVATAAAKAAASVTRRTPSKSTARWVTVVPPVSAFGL